MSMKSEYILPELSRTVSQLPETSVSTVSLHYLEHGCLMRRMLIHVLMSEQVTALGCGYKVLFCWSDSGKGNTLKFPFSSVRRPNN